ncbi:MAG: hypothetical protein KUA35_09080 [Pseudodesulfovibrio sp.]|uniref:hypothetical protein n=1 Tax=Pseudodesulfovibrio TaxID=2035811 RepID=UPI0001BFAB47|nr:MULTISPECIES: hypothetical protein [Pseudodesulfovibrio]MBU4244510.1 hypothetical protein [Pseudomonadota bacterium]MBU4379856.1 hypothetical protein [Pseudomonadota bacterium]MBU4475222.1 hypothetical protein [Pseudomonadota bacterium]MBU4516261.1 hypothetical protein [Pseudomonadota bacterium]MBU4522440.1 hypothetical protein [Pseudomonadota bacterium]
MVELIGYSFVVDLFYTAVALLLLFFGLRLLDARSGRPWTDTIRIIRKDPHATALYYAARWIGACLLVGLLLSR